MSRYLQDRRGRFAGSIGDGRDQVPRPSDAPVVVMGEEGGADEPVTEVYTAYSTLARRVVPVDPLRADRAPLPPMSPEEEDRRADARRWVSAIPDDPVATERYLEMVAADLDVDADAARFRYDLLHAGAAGDADFVTDPDLLTARYVHRLPDGSLVGTPGDPVTLSAMAQMETVAAIARRERRAQVETVDEHGVRWVRYANERYSEVLRGVHYDSEARRVTVLLDGRGGPVTQYDYRDVDPSIVAALVSSRSMGRFYAFTLGKLPPGGSMAGLGVREYPFVAHYANFLWPTGATRGPVPSRRALAAISPARTGR